MERKKSTEHLLETILDKKQLVFSSVVDSLIREIHEFVPRHGMWDLIDWDGPLDQDALETMLRGKLKSVRLEYEEQTEVLRHRRDELIAQVQSVFAKVKLGNGISIRQAHVIDGYGSDEEQARARRQDQESHWSEVDVAAKDPGGSAMTFMDAEGFRFYLPAYLVHYLKHEFRRLGELGGTNNLSGLESRLAKEEDHYWMLSDQQKRCVADFLLFDFEISEDADSLRALRKHWMQYLPEDQQSVLK